MNDLELKYINIGVIIIVLGYISYNVIKINNEKIEHFGDPAKELEKAKEEIVGVVKSITKLEDEFESLFDEMESFGGKIEGVVKQIDKLDSGLTEKITGMIGKFFKDLAKKITNPKTFLNILKKLGDLIWDGLKSIYNAAYKAEPRIAYIPYYFLFLAVSPLVQVYIGWMLLMSSFIGPQIVFPLFLLAPIFAYIFRWQIFKYVINVIVNAINSIPWEDIFNDIVKKVSDFFEDIFDDISKAF